MQYGLYRGSDGALIQGYVTPVSKMAYIDVAFQYVPNDGILPRTFRNLAFPLTDRILQSMLITHTSGNPIKRQVEQLWHQITVDELLKLNSERLILKLFGTSEFDDINASLSKKPVELPPELSGVG